jgi:hypothetical protein
MKMNLFRFLQCFCKYCIHKLFLCGDLDILHFVLIYQNMFSDLLWMIKKYFNANKIEVRTLRI